MKRIRPVGVRADRRRGFTLTEILVTMLIMGIVAAAVFPLFIVCHRFWRSVNLRVEVDRRATLALNRMVYGVGASHGLRTARQGTVMLTPAEDGWSLSYVDVKNRTNRIVYSQTDHRLTLHPGPTTLGEQIESAQAVVNPRTLDLTVRVHQVEGRFEATGMAQTSIRWRN